MKKSFLLLIAISALLSNRNVTAQDAFVSNKLEKVWEATDGMDVPESSHYNEADKTIYVSNIVGKHNVKDGQGFISKLDAKGQVITKAWATGLNAPKGVGCTKDKLYVSDIDRLVEIDLKSGRIIKEYANPKSKSLNDVTVAQDGRVFVSDSNGDCVFYLGKDSLEVFLQSDDLKKMNGILAKGDFLYLGSQGNFISINQKTREIKILAEGVGYLDGIEQVGEDKFVTSDFGGSVQLIEVGKGVEKLLDTTPMKINAADLGYIQAKELLLVPTFYKNSVVAYKLKLK